MEPEVTMFGLIIQFVVIVVISFFLFRAVMREYEMSNRPDPACDKHIQRTKEYLESRRSKK